MATLAQRLNIFRSHFVWPFIQTLTVDLRLHNESLLGGLFCGTAFRHLLCRILGLDLPLALFRRNGRWVLNNIPDRGKPPPRKVVRGSVESCQRVGVRPKWSGDHFPGVKITVAPSSLPDANTQNGDFF